MTSYAYHPMLVGIVSVSARHWQRHLAKVAKYRRHNTPFCPPTTIRPSLLPGPLTGALVLSPQGNKCYTAVQSQLRKKYCSWPPFICNSLYKALGLRSSPRMSNQTFVPYASSIAKIWVGLFETPLLRLQLFAWTPPSFCAPRCTLL